MIKLRDKINELTTLRATADKARHEYETAVSAIAHEFGIKRSVLSRIMAAHVNDNETVWELYEKAREIMSVIDNAEL